jgi:hypothetical protein
VKVALCGQRKAKATKGFLVDLAGLDPALSSVRWIKMQGKGVKFRLLRPIYAKITILFLHICTRIVPKLCRNMYRYEARKGNPKPCLKGGQSHR